MVGQAANQHAEARFRFGNQHQRHAREIGKYYIEKPIVQGGMGVGVSWAQSVWAMAGVASHAPTHDRQAAWNDEQVKAWLRRTRPLVERFASGIPAHLEMIGLPETTRNRLRALLLDA